MQLLQSQLVKLTGIIGIIVPATAGTSYLFKAKYRYILPMCVGVCIWLLFVPWFAKSGSVVFIGFYIN